MSTRPSTALVRFLLVGLMAVARVLCPCPAVEAAHAAHPTGNASHSCCDKTTGRHHAKQQTDHTHGDGCEHCADSPQLKPAVSGGAEAALAPPGEALALPDIFRPASATTLVPGRFRPADAAHPPLTLWRLRTVVLLI